MEDEKTTEGSPGSSPEESKGLRGRMLGQLRREAAVGVAAGGHVAAQLGHAAGAMALEIVPTGLRADRALVGHVLGMHLAIPASHLHGPRESPALLYLFADALAVRPTDDAPMSTVPLFGLHMVLPPVAIARWAYKAGRTEHANLDLVEEAQHFASSLDQWTVDDFAEADPKLQVHRTGDLGEPFHVYEHLGYAHLSIPIPDGRPTRLKSALPVSSNAFVKLWQLFTLVSWPHGLSTEVPSSPAEAPENVRGDPAGDEGSPGAPAPDSAS